MKLTFLFTSLLVASNAFALDTTVTVQSVDGTTVEQVAVEDGVDGVLLIEASTRVRSRTTTALFYSGQWCSGQLLSRSSVVVTGNNWDFTQGQCVGPGGLSRSQRVGGVCYNNYRPKYDSCTW